MRSYDLAAWSDLFVATAGAGAALAGLVFVAVSINIARVLELPGVPERGLQTVVVLLSAVIVSVFGLVPQTDTAYGIEAIGVGAAFSAFMAVSLPRSMAGTRGHPGWIASRFGPTVPSGAAYLTGGATLIAGVGGGLAWILAGIVVALVGAVINAWVLLVEILR